MQQVAKLILVVSIYGLGFCSSARSSSASDSRIGPLNELSFRMRSAKNGQEASSVGDTRHYQTAPPLSRIPAQSVFNQWQNQLVQSQLLAQRDHELREKWLIDNINDLHRELKQTEGDFEHYFQVTKDLIARNEARMNSHVNNILARTNTYAGPFPVVAPIPVTITNHHQHHHQSEPPIGWVSPMANWLLNQVARH